MNLEPNWYWDNSGNNFGWLGPPSSGIPILCPGLGGISLAGYTTNSPIQQPDASIITLCKAAIDPRILGGNTLTSLAAVQYGDNQVALDDIVTTTVSFTLIHEATHTAAFVSRPLTYGKNNS